MLASLADPQAALSGKPVDEVKNAVFNSLKPIMNYLDDHHIKWEWSEYGSFDYHYLDIHDVESISVSAIDGFECLIFWIQDQKYEIDGTIVLETISRIQLYPNHLLRLYIDPEYYAPFDWESVFQSACKRHGWIPVSHEKLDLRPGGSIPQKVGGSTYCPLCSKQSYPPTPDSCTCSHIPD
jgi:hypothetical protein